MLIPARDTRHVLARSDERLPISFDFKFALKISMVSFENGI